MFSKTEFSRNITYDTWLRATIVDDRHEKKKDSEWKKYIKKKTKKIFYNIKIIILDKNDLYSR